MHAMSIRCCDCQCGCGMLKAAQGQGHSPSLAFALISHSMEPLLYNSVLAAWCTHRPLWGASKVNAFLGPNNKREMAQALQPNEVVLT